MKPGDPRSRGLENIRGGREGSFCKIQDMAPGHPALPSPKRRRHQPGGPVFTNPQLERNLQTPETPSHVDLHGHAYGYYASSWARKAGNGSFPNVGEPPEFVKTRLEAYRLLDFKPMLNTASYVNVVGEPQEWEIANEGLKINIADQTIYPGSQKMHDDCLQMVADLWNLPMSEKDNGVPGTCTVGSTEACLLAGLALKFRWRAWYAQKKNLTAGQARRAFPNLVISTLYQAAWEKFFKYMDVEPRFIQGKVQDFTLDPTKIEAVADENTIGIVCILGNHYSGHFDEVHIVDEICEKLNREKGWNLGIHVDAASGGFIAPFQRYAPPWDFRLKNVLSISASGHKFGLSCIGTGWVVWRSREGLSEHVATSVSYLGGKADSYTLNFSRPASGVSVQFYKFLRLGREGYSRLVDNTMFVAEFIRNGLRNFRDAKTKLPVFRILDFGGGECCLPVVAAQLNTAIGYPFTDVDMQHVLAERHWYVGSYRMSFTHPLDEVEMSLFEDEAYNSTMFRVVVKVNLTMDLAKDLLSAFGEALNFLGQHSAGYRRVLHGGGDVGDSKEVRDEALHPPC